MKRKSTKRKHFFRFAAVLFLLTAATFLTPQAALGQKQIYEPQSMRAALASPDGQWSYERSRESDNFIIFWEAGFGSDPSAAPSPYTVDVDQVLRVADEAFNYYADTLGFVVRGKSKTDTYKMVIRLYYQTEWLATGSGEDGMIGVLNINPSTVQPAGHTVAHEVGHCFQYQTQCDLNDPQRGFNYGFGPGGAGGNCWWEQCAQWQAFCLYPDIIFTDYRFAEYLQNHHKHILHETPRYANYFIQWCWTDKWGTDFIGRMWREARYLEDPVDAYKRMNNVDQEGFNDDMYEFNARLATWDVPFLRERGKNYINARAQCQLIREDSAYYRIAPEQCPENYGYNVIRLNVPESDTTVKVYFESITPDGTTYRRVDAVNGELRFGFVALGEDGTRTYSDMGKATYLAKRDTIAFECPAGCQALLLVVSGGTRTHTHHEWDDDDSNDEQRPYRVKVEGVTGLYGEYNNPDGEPHNASVTTEVSMPVLSGYGTVVAQPDVQAVCEAFCMSLQEIGEGLENGTITYAAVQPNGSLHTTPTANGFGHWFAKTGYVCSWGSTAYLFSELREPASLNFYIGQYDPSNCKPGDEAVIRQRLTCKIDGKSYHVTFYFNVHITYPSAIGDIEAGAAEAVAPFQIVWDGSRVVLPRVCRSVVLYGLDGRPLQEASGTDALDMAAYPAGCYLLQADGAAIKFFKQ